MGIFDVLGDGNFWGGVAGGINNGLGVVQSIQDRRRADRLMQLREQQMRAEMEQGQLDRERDNMELGIREGFTPTEARFGNARITSGGMQGSPVNLPTSLFEGTPMRPNAPGDLMGQRIGMANQPKPSSLFDGAAGRFDELVTPRMTSVNQRASQVAPQPEVAFRRPFVEQDINQSLAVKRQDALNAREAQARAVREDEARLALPEELRPLVGVVDLDTLGEQAARLAVQPPPQLRTGFQPGTGDLLNLDDGSVIRRGADPQAVPGASSTGLPPDMKDADKTKIEGLRVMTPLIQQYRGLVTEFLGMNPLNRARALSPLGSSEQQALVGRISSLRETLSFAVKNLEGLGALQEGEIKLLQRMIGDALSTQSVIRDPQFTLSRLDQIERYLDEKVRAMSSTMGISEDAIRGNQGARSRMPTGHSPADPDAVIDEMIAAGATDEEIRRALEGR